MALTKYASLEVAQILEVKGSRDKITGAGLDKLASYEDYRTDDGYLYTRVRAISSRVNKNHDGWPSEELAKSYLTFIGKPIFVDHNNSDPSRARGVIVDAKLHIENDFEKAAALDPYYSSAPENHKPPTWVELLLEVDAKAFPHLARAVVNDEIDGVSMGANVERSKCSHCANWATSPEEYCIHVLQKGAHFDKYDDFGRKTTSAAYEDCYDIGFFEISYVFDPADETALDLGDKRHAIAKTAARADGTFDGDPTTCSTCGGSGQADTGPCSTCHGRGVETWPKEDGRTQADSFIDKHMAGWMDEPARGDKTWQQFNQETGPVERNTDGLGMTPQEAALTALHGGGDPIRMLKGLFPGMSDQEATRELQAAKEGQKPMGTADPFNDDPFEKDTFRIGSDGSVKYAGPMDMGGYGDGMTPAAAPTPAGAVPQPTGDTNCPQCGGAMQDGVCPQCSAVPNEAPAPGGMAPVASIDKHGNVKYSEYDMGMTPDKPIPGDDTMDKLRAAPDAPHDPVADADAQAVADDMGETPRAVAEKALQVAGGDADKAFEIMKQWFPEMSDFDALYEINHNIVGAGDSPEMPNDPFLSHIAKDGTVHYAEAPLPQSMMTTAPESVDTLRQEKICTVCGSDMDEGKCDVCGYEVPPEGFDNPDLQKAQEIAEQGAAEGGAPGEPPPGAMAPPGAGAPGAGGSIGTPAPSGPPAGAGGGAAMAATNNARGTIAVKNAGKIRSNETPIIPATKTVSDHPTTTTVTKEPTRLVQSNTKDNMTKTLTKAAVVAQMVKRGTSGVKTEAEAEALLKKSGLDRLLAANPASDPAEHHQNVDQVGGDVSNPESDTQHINVEKAVDIEKIPTMTWSDGKGDSLGQESPVTSEKFEGGGPIGTQAGTKVADGQSGITGDPTNAEKQIDVEKPIGAEGTVGPDTQTFKSDDFHITDPVTTENSNQIGGPIGVAMASAQRSQVQAHTFASLKLAEEMVNVGLIPEEQKWETAAQLLNESPEQLSVRTEMISKTRTAGLAKNKVASSPKLPLGANSTRTASVGHDINDDHIGDAGLFR